MSLEEELERLKNSPAPSSGGFLKTAGLIIFGILLIFFIVIIVFASDDDDHLLKNFKDPKNSLTAGQTQIKIDYPLGDMIDIHRK